MTAPGAAFSPQQAATLNWLVIVTSALSFFGSLFACACYIAFRHKRTFGLQLVFLMSLNDAVCQVWVAIQFMRVWEVDSALEHKLCIAESFAVSYFVLAGILWSSAIAYTLFVTIIYGHQLHEVSRRLPFIILFCQGVPLVSCVVSELFNAYGKSSAWCWIESTNPTDRILQFATMYIPCWLCLAFNLYVYISVRLRLRALFSESSHWAHTAPAPPPAPPSLSTLGHTSTSSLWISQTDFEAESNVFGSATSEGEEEEGSYVELVETGTAPHTAGLDPALSRPSQPPSIASQRNKLRKLSRRLMVYPMILILCWSWATVDRIRGLFYPGQNLFWLSLLHIVFVALQGLLNSIAYGLTEGIGGEISARLGRRQLRRR